MNTKFQMFLALLVVIFLFTGCANNVGKEDKAEDSLETIASEDVFDQAEEISSEEEEKKSDEAEGSEENDSSPLAEGAFDESSNASEEKEEVVAVFPAKTVETLSVEAGTKEIKVIDLLLEGENPEGIEIVYMPTEEELKVTGATYAAIISSAGIECSVPVNIVDTTAPVIEAKEISVEEGKSVSYKKNVTYSDNSSDELELEIDKSQANTSVPGDYDIIYKVSDSSGNVSTATTKLHVLKASKEITEESVKKEARKILDDIVTDDMSDYDKAYAAFKWVNKKIRYTYGEVDDSSFYAAAHYGFKNKSGECYVTYACLKVLLDELGIDNIHVERSGGKAEHHWLLVNVGDGWYHCDAGAHLKTDPYTCFMQTDEQVAEYTKNHDKYHPENPDYYSFDKDAYPERATDIIFVSGSSK